MGRKNRQSAIRLRQGFGEQIGNPCPSVALAKAGAIGNKFQAAQDPLFV
jgi:hypothetical protein